MTEKSTHLRGIPIVQTGSKYQTEQGFPAIKNGVKTRHDAPEIQYGDKPSWLRAKMPSGAGYSGVRQTVRQHRLSTVCEESMCPNIGECWNDGTATIMVLGSVCTRACRFCAVDTGNPHGWLDAEEPLNTARAVKLMNLKYVVITSVDRDDLDDGGAGHYAACVQEIKKMNPNTAVEALTPDFNAGYRQTIDVLAHAKKHRPDVLTKTSLMLGLGERDHEIIQTMHDLHNAGVDIVTLGQYLRPTPNHLAIERYVSPGDFAAYRQEGLDIGFLEVVAGPLVRSSYRAERVLQKNNVGIAV